MVQDGQGGREVDGFRAALKGSTRRWICCGNGVRKVQGDTHWPLSVWQDLVMTWGVEGTGWDGRWDGMSTCEIKGSLLAT